MPGAGLPWATVSPVPDALTADDLAPLGGLAAPGAPVPAADDDHGFRVRLDEFEGPFDLLLQLISKHKLEVTELSLHQVTDDFVAYIRAQGAAWDLDETTEFLVVAATLLDLKTARLLPSGEVEDEDDLALLEARDVLFARLLQYRAYKEVAALLAARMADESRRRPRAVGLEPRFASLLPEVLLGIGPEQFATLAAGALAPKEAPVLSVAHVHEVRVSVREQAAVLVERLRRTRSITFRSLVADCDTTLLVVARFLALLELFRDGSVAFEQVSPLADLHVRWTGADEGEIELDDEFDDEEARREAAAEGLDEDGTAEGTDQEPVAGEQEEQG
jgi:segregation and condensation protein A